MVDANTAQVETLCGEFPDEHFYLSLPAARDAASRGGQFNVIHPKSGNKIDFMVARRDAWGREQLKRRQREQVYPEVLAYMASPEDIILAKLWYYQIGESEKHLRDIAAIFQNADGEIQLDLDREVGIAIGAGCRVASDLVASAHKLMLRQFSTTSIPLSRRLQVEGC